MEQFKDLKKRVIVSSTVIAFLIALIYFSKNPYVLLLITLIAACIGVIGVWEFGKIAAHKGVHLNKPMLAIISAAYILSMQISIIFPQMGPISWVILAIGFFIFFIQQFHQISGAMVFISMHIFAVIYVAVPMGLLLWILCPRSLGHPACVDGRLWFAYLIIIIKCTDIGAYFGGKLMGKRPLASQLSPKKTIEGAITGFITAIVLSILFSLYSSMIRSDSFHLNMVHAIILGAVLSVIGQIGDLSESLLKRDAQIKDSNNIPGLGGVLDTFDSLLFGIPVIYFYLSYVC